ncbi:hypothetical protein JEQ12_019687 [Ovis aries]|uniref:Uncharacterized protein n=1 Tax=Ovis aries TaxID=9940 RepID=A0A835ZGG9_SHEEP|nr:hypothetical protein JEQ12_019687 [Ovis aries]
MENNSLSLQWNQACQTYIHNESYARGSTVTLTMVVNKTLLDPIFSQESMMNFTMAVDMDFSSVQEISPGMPPRGDSVPNNGVDLQFVQVQVVFLLAFLMEVTDVIGKDDSHDALNHDSNHEILQVSQNEMLSYLQMPTTLLYCRYSDSRQEIKMNLLAVKAVLADVQVSDDVHLPHITASSIHISRCALQVLSSTQDTVIRPGSPVCAVSKLERVPNCNTVDFLRSYALSSMKMTVIIAGVVKDIIQKPNPWFAAIVLSAFPSCCRDSFSIGGEFELKTSTAILSIGIGSLDKLLDAYLYTGEVTGITGGPGSSKTQARTLDQEEQAGALQRIQVVPAFDIFQMLKVL